MTQRAQEILNRLPSGPVLGAEIGVFSGKTSAVLLGRSDLVLCMIDTWDPFVADGILIASGEEQETNRLEALRATDFARERRHVIRQKSIQAADCVEDCALDFAFIDGDHSYIAVGADVRAWLPKIKPGGMLCGHDYANQDYEFGDEVKWAVDDVAKEYGWTVELGKDYTWFVRL